MDRTSEDVECEVFDFTGLSPVEIDAADPARLSAAAARALAADADPADPLLGGDTGSGTPDLPGATP